MSNKQVWNLTEEQLEQDRFMLDRLARMHAIAVESAREHSGFESEQAIHAFAAFISIEARKARGNPRLLVITRDQAREALDDIYAAAERYEFDDVVAAFVTMTSVVYGVDVEAVRAEGSRMALSRSDFNSVKRHYALAQLLVAKYAARTGRVIRALEIVDPGFYSDPSGSVERLEEFVFEDDGGE